MTYLKRVSCLVRDICNCSTLSKSRQFDAWLIGVQVFVFRINYLPLLNSQIDILLFAQLTKHFQLQSKLGSMKKLFTLLFALVVCGTLSAQYTEDFESGAAGWEIPAPFAVTNATDLSSQYFGIDEHTLFVGVNDDGVGAGVTSYGFVVSPAIDLADIGNPILSFESFFINGDFDADETAKVFVSTDGVNWDEVLDIPGSTSGWVNTQANISAYGGQTIYLAFEYNDGGGWNYGFCFDDLLIEEYSIEREAELKSATANCAGGTVGKEIEISGSFVNNGTMPLTSVDITWTDGTNSETTNLSGLNVQLFEEYDFVLNGTAPLPAGGGNITVTLANVNGMGADENTANDTGSFGVAGLTPAADRGVIYEEATGTWCGWCPRGTAWLKIISDCYGENFIGIAVHNGDPMVLNEYDNGVTSFPGFPGFPSGLFERKNIVDPGAIEAPFQSAVVTPAVARLRAGATYDEGSRQLTVTAFADLNEAIADGYRFNAVLIEDGVTGTGAGYNQANYYSGGGAGPMFGWEDLPSTVPAADMVYDHVGRALLGGYAGVANSVNATAAGESASYTFDTYTIPAGYDENNMHIVIMLIDNAGQIVNGWSQTIDEAVDFLLSNEEVTINNDAARIAPNPTTGATNVFLTLDGSKEVTMTIMNAVGQTVAIQDFGKQSGNAVLPIDAANLDAGVYLVHLVIDGTLVTKKLVVSK